MNRAFTLCVAALVFTAACQKSADDAPPELTILPMVPDSQLTMTIATNNALIDFQWILGDRTALATWYSDSTTVSVAGIGTYRGKPQLDSMWAGRAKELGVVNMQRTSAGWSVADRVVTDSGSYQLEGELVKANAMKDMTGRYTIRWHYTTDGKWEIVSDELVGVSQKRGTN